MYTKTIDLCANHARRIVYFNHKNKLGFWISSAIAGAYVGLGIILIFTIGQLLEPSLRPLIMGITFGIALTLVIIAGSELFTGHTLYLTLGVTTKKITMTDMSYVLPQTWLGNLVGAVILSLIYMMCDSSLLASGSLIHASALVKTTASASTLFFKGLLCNWLVCLAVWMALRVDGTAKFIAIWWCLFAFITSGYEHSVANMSIFALSYLGSHHQDFTLSGIMHNLFWVTFGNLVSGVFFVALSYLTASKNNQIK